MAYVVPYHQRERSRSRGRSVGSADSRSSSISSTHRLNMEGNFPPVQRWNGQTREATDWNSLRRDPELWHPQGNCLVYLFERGASRRGPSFRIPYDFLLYSSCRPLIDHSMTAGLQTSLYHPGSTTPPSYDNLSDTLSHESSYCSLHLDAPADMSMLERHNYHITTRNFFAWLVGTPLVGSDPVSALLNLKVRMDIWRDSGADNFGSLFQYVQEQSYGDFEDLEIQMGKRLDGEAVDVPRPYRNVSRTLEEQENEVERGRRRSSISSIGQAFRSGSRRLRKKVSRTFSRSRAPSESRTGTSPVDRAPPAQTLRLDVHKIMQPQIRTQSPPQLAASATTPPAADDKTPKPKKRESSLTRFAKRRLSWAAGPLRSDGEPPEMDSGMFEPAPSGSPVSSAAGPPESPLTALPVLASSSRTPLSLLTHNLDSSASAPNVPMRSSRRPSSSILSHLDGMNSVGFSPRSSSSSRVSMQDLSICACCGKPRKPSAEGIDPSKIALHAEQVKHTRGGSMYSEISVPNYGNGTASSAGSKSGRIRRSSAQRQRARHSSTHSFISLNGSVAPTPPGLDYGYGSLSDSGPVSPISRDGSVDPDPRGRRRPSIGSPTLVGVNGMHGGGNGLVSSPASNHSMDQMIWQLGQGNGSGSSNEGGDESEIKKGKKRASVDSDTLGALAAYHLATTLPAQGQLEYEQSTGMDMIGQARGSGYGFDRMDGRRGEAVELPA